MDQDKDAQKDSPGGDNELENLSSDEKAAFEKIMAEIAAATGGGAKSTDDDSAKMSKPDSAGNPSATPVSSADQAPPSTDDNQAKPDEIISEISPNEENAVTATTNDAKTEIGPPSEDLSEDQQAALDQIMAEIGSKRKTEATPAKHESSGTADEELSQDQQAALDSIMAEIGSKRKAEKAPDDTQAVADNADEPLSEDQQAALNSIMAEIGAKRKADAPQLNEPAQEDAQADIEKIMAEIEVKKGRDASSKNSGSPKKSSENLTMEEFDDELSNLLASAEAAPAAKSAARSKIGEMPKTERIVPVTDLQTHEAEDPSKENPGTSSEKESPPAPANKEYPILKEISVDPESKKKAKNQGAGSGPKPRADVRKLARIAAVVAGLLVTCIGGYWGLHHRWRQPVPNAQAAPDSSPVPTAPSGNATVSQPLAAPPAINPGLLAAEEPIRPVVNTKMETSAMMLSSAIGRLTAGRQQIQTKISDIQQLKSYYSRGIEEETQKIEDALQSGQIPSFDAALADKKIELAMRAVQRRRTYIAKLESPLKQLTTMSEQLLYMERRARIYEVLQTGINGLPVEAFTKEVDEKIGRYLEFNTQISIDQVELQPPELETIWAQIESDLKQKANLLAQRAPLNRAISEEICKGDYERKYLLSALSAETAECLIKWEGKDLYLNSLSELPPDVAKILAQWPGEWISLNGLRQLEVESARHLSQWPGNRMSLNGLSELAPEATAYLSQWKGSQLEMVGLQSIGSWENYGTRLYLSEKLRKQLGAQ